MLTGPDRATRGKRDGSTPDEAYAWQAREFIRKKCVGKVVVFRTEYTVPSGREFGTVFLGQENLAVALVAAGLAKVRDGGSRDNKDVYEQLKGAETAAMTAGLGMWSSDPASQAASVRAIPRMDAVTPEELLHTFGKGQTVRGVVEQVGVGHIMRVTLVPSFHFLPIFLAGVVCPGVGRRPQAEGADPTPPEPFGIEAKYFSEVAVLNREVAIALDGVDKYGNMFGTVTYTDPAGTSRNLGEQLLAIGYAKAADWGLKMVAPLAAAGLRRAQKAAQDGRRAIWRNWTPPPKTSAALSGEYRGRVVEVVSGDCVVVKHAEDQQERRVMLSSVRAPRMGNREGLGAEPYAKEAKGFLRQRLIGKEVKVKMEYTRTVGGAPKAAEDGAPAKPAGPERTLEFGTVYIQGRGEGGQPADLNVAEMLLVRGLGTAVKHRSEDDKSSHYEDLLEAEAKAMKGKKAVHSSKQPPLVRVNDVSGQGQASRAKQFLPFLQRAGRMNAVVEYVLSGHRFKVFSPKDSVTFTLALSGVRCPGKGEPFADKALAFSRGQCLQRDVEIEVYELDQRGTFLGSLYLKQFKQEFSAALLGRGLAKIHGYNVPQGSPLVAAMEAAKAKKAGLWEGYEEAAQAPASPQDSGKSVEKMTVAVSNVLFGGKFAAQKTPNQLAQVTESLGKLGADGPADGPVPKAGMDCLGKFSGDGQWYRAKVTAIEGGRYTLHYFDFGNSEVVGKDAVRPMPLTLGAIPPQALLCSLAFIKVPSREDEFGQDAAMLLHQLVGAGQPLEAEVVDRVEEENPSGRGRRTVTVLSLTDPATKTNVSAEMVREGLGYLTRRQNRRFTETIEPIRELQAAAKKQRLACWQYGDIDSDDEY